ncbi:AMP-binding protein [Thiocapsa sp.]|uniref:AMP-binding protein n=1 Tax=Thiocapsa sp. TaxID=2024551 RepID=UPI003593E9E6
MNPNDILIKTAALFPDQEILISPEKRLTSKELLDRSSRIANALLDLGLKKGDKVGVLLTNSYQSVESFCGITSAGMVRVPLNMRNSAREHLFILNNSEARAVMVGEEYTGIIGSILPEATNLGHAICVTGTPPAPMLSYEKLISQASPEDPKVEMTDEDVHRLSYTSGTTGQPKGVVRDNGGHAVAMAWSMENVYNVKPGEVFWAASDVGWVVGHSYIVYAPLLAGCTTIVYEGKPVGTPDAGAFWRVISEHGVSVLFTAPTAFRAIKRDDPNAEHLGRYDLGTLRALFLAGERCDPDTLGWAQKILGISVIDHWWQTETGWAIAANCLGIEQLPVKPGSPTRAVPGYDIQVLDDEGVPVGPGDIGRIMIKLPLPPGCLPTLWGNDARFIQSYLSAQPGYYLTGDAGYLDEDGYLFVMSRIDDIINVAGHRLSTGAMEGVLASHPDVAECAVIGAYDQLKGELPLGLVVLKSGVSRDDALIIKELVNLVRDQIGPVAAFKTVVVVQRLPKTRSGKILRGTMKSIADGKDYRMPATIDDPAILAEIETALGKIGYAQHA